VEATKLELTWGRRLTIDFIPHDTLETEVAHLFWPGYADIDGLGDAGECEDEGSERDLVLHDDGCFGLYGMLN
jgi:hypothetical protein